MLNSVPEGCGLHLRIKQIVLFAVKKRNNKFLRITFFSVTYNAFDSKESRKQYSVVCCDENPSPRISHILYNPECTDVNVELYVCVHFHNNKNQEYAIRKVQDNRESLELNGLHQRLVYTNDVNMLGENPHTIRENTEILLEANKAIGLEVNPEKTKYMIMSRDHNIVRNRNIKIGSLSFEEVETFKYLGATVTNINDTREEIKHRINMGNACYYSVEKNLSASLLSKNLKVRFYKTVILPVVLYGCET
ncbi:hypothetical protein ANN_06832 [Periplaneta americana]|uniref:Reverse transcriptase domain-containing protein n=1 Tax=Periplaneta americana TaxID=6978 RepID=A0ABQ8TEK1_PERAM|nr:hypothetical protein ANN_06832 [Periplaneta americana]